MMKNKLMTTAKNVFTGSQLLMFLILLITCNGIAQNLLNNPESVVFDSPRNRYIISNWGNGAIVQMDSNEVQSYFNTDYLNQYRIAALYIHNDTLLAAAGDAPNAGVIGFDIETGQQLFHVILPGVGLPNDIVTDNDGFIYVTDYWDSKLYKIENHTPSVLIDSGLANPNGMMIDTLNNRLLILSVVPNAQILAVNLSDTAITTVYTTTFLGMDGITVDSEGRIYVSEWAGDAVHRFENGFSSPPVLFSSGHLDPADIYYDRVNNILAVPCFSSNSVDFIHIVPQSIENGKNSLPSKIELYQNYPNPFNPSTTIEYYLSKMSNVELKIYNLFGQEVKTLVNGFQTAGNKSVVWNGVSNLNQVVAAGIYYYKIQVGKEAQCRKMLYLK
jgi:hypothetical protein